MRRAEGAVASNEIELLFTIYNSSTSYLPQDETKSPYVGLFIGLKNVNTNTLVQNLRCHITLGAHSWVIADIKIVIRLRVNDSKT